MLRRKHEREDVEVALLERLDRIERRLADVEDTIEATLGRHRLDDISEQVDELAMTATTHDDLLSVRMHSARLAAEVTRSVVELQAEQAGLRDALADHVSGRDAQAG